MLRRSLVSQSVILLTLLVLAACGDPTPVRKPQGSSAAGTQAYLQDLSMAHLSFERKPNDYAAAEPYVKDLNKYALKKAPKPVPVTVVVLGYKTRDDQKSRKLMVPITAPQGRATDYSPIRKVTNTLAGSRPEYRSVLVRTATLATREALPVGKGKTEQVENKVHDMYQTVYESVQTPPRSDAARLQMGLTRFFMLEGIRDAAYVSLENAKELLAGVDTSQQGDANEVQALSRELEKLEDTLHKKLPYTF